jgi:hypothetical protein
MLTEKTKLTALVMQRPIACLLLFISIVQNPCIGQSTEKAFPTTLQSPGDTFYVRFSNYAELIPMTVRKKDTVDMGTDGAPGLSATIYTGKDSVRFSYTNLPYGQVHYIPVQTPSKKIIYRLHFNGIIAAFSDSYMEKNEGRVQTEIPELYELANIIWTLSPTGQGPGTLYKEGNYYKKVLDYFKPYLNHPVFKKLNFPDSLYYKNYYDFRENSFAYSFKGDRIVYEGPYYYVMGDDWDNYTSLFGTLRSLVEDFAKKTRFHEFFKSNKDFYDKQITRINELLPVKNMWTWLEQEFPKYKYQSYKVVFSPLIGGSHSTQNFTTYNRKTDKFFREAVMFICGADRYDTMAITEKQKQGLMSGIVFTEIDHNYVNPASSRFYQRIDSIFSKRNVWADNADAANWYGSPMSVFNEYMTHALFCLWIMDSYDKATSDYVINARESLMVNRRHFIRFKEFNQALIALREKDKTVKVADLFPAILEWCRGMAE